jgi:hypothetical protein
VRSWKECVSLMNALLRARIARRCLLMAWRESDYFLALTVLGAIMLVLVVPMVVLVWKAVQE